LEENQEIMLLYHFVGNRLCISTSIGSSIKGPFPSFSSFVESKLIQMAMVILCQKKMAMVIFKLLFLLK
jgi:hypothetical protein